MLMREERRKRIEEVSARRQLDLAVVLENVHDPHNIAAVVRSCDAVGIQTVYALYTDPAINTKKLRLGKRTSAGARKWVDVHLYTDVGSCVTAVREHCDLLIATRLSGDSMTIYKTDFLRSTALVFGNEHSGVSDELMSHVDGSIEIPQMGMVQSLNISVACAITLFEICRQRLIAGYYDDNPSQKGGKREALLRDWIERHESQHKGRAFKRYDQ